MSELQTYTFWQLATEYKIEIPIIQRDYAQGRSDDKSKEIRDFFLKEIHSILQSKNETLNLDFVYGKIDENIFIPIDGQQRLTTLYLLHWYLATKFSQDFSVIKGFTYKTRVSSRDFCKKLTSSAFNLIELEKEYKKLQLNDKCNRITESFLTFEIKNCEWYHLSWDTDTTVQSMLNTLDSIHSKFSDLPKDVWFKLIETTSIMYNENIKLNKLIATIENLHDENVNLALLEFKKKPPITFKFLNLKDFKLSDELYLKMNGRGKALSDFEKFKAWFFGHTDFFLSEDITLGLQTNISNIIKEDWKNLFDSVWTDWVWNNRVDNKITKSEFFDRAIISFVKNIAFINYFEIYVDQETKEFKDVYPNYLEKNNNTTFLKGIYIHCFKTKDNIKYLLNTFQVLSIKLKFLKESYLFPSKWENDNKKISGNIFGNTTFKEKSILYAIVKFYENDINRIGFDEWLRIIRNLVENTDIDKDNFKKILGSIAELAINENYVELIKKTVFDGEQKEEELIKYHLMYSKVMNGEEWKKAIIEIEEHPLFKGKIGFLLPDNEKSDLQIFIKRSMIAMSLFDAKCAINDNNDFLTIRGIFCFCEEINLPITILNNKDSWKKLLRNINIQSGFIKMIDEINNDYKGKINKKIAGFNDKSTFWKYYLIKNADLIKHVDAAKIQAFPNHLTESPFIFLCNSPERLSELSISISNNRNELVSHLITIYKFKFIRGDSYQIENKYFKGWNLRVTKEIENSTDNNQMTLLLEQERVIIETKHFSDMKEYSFKNGYDNLLIELKKDHPGYFL